MYESRHQRPIPHQQFVGRLFRHFGFGTGILLLSLFAGMAGYAYYEHMNWLDSFLNASMILGGMGPVAIPTTPGGKLFAGFYALYSGGIFLVIVGIVLAPAFHRLLHRFHWEDKP